MESNKYLYRNGYGNYVTVSSYYNERGERIERHETHLADGVKQIKEIYPDGTEREIFEYKAL